MSLRLDGTSVMDLPDGPHCHRVETALITDVPSSQSGSPRREEPEGTPDGWPAGREVECPPGRLITEPGLLDGQLFIVGPVA